MFDVSCDTILPVEYVEIQSISVRGELGPLTVWQTPNTFQGKHEEMEESGRRCTTRRTRRAAR